MIDSLSTALSGLLASKKRTDVAANNIANARTAGSIPGEEVEQPKDVFIPSRIEQESLTTYSADGRPQGAGVRADVKKQSPGYEIAPDPGASYANQDGLVAVPAVNLEAEIINLKLATTTFKANASVIRTIDEMNNRLLDIKT